MEVVFQDIGIFFWRVCRLVLSFFLEVSWVVDFHVPGKIFHDFKGYIPGCFWILFEVKDLALVDIEVLPVSFCLAFGSLKVHLCPS